MVQDPGSEPSSLGPTPGSVRFRGRAPSDSGGIYGGRPGPSVPRVPVSLLQGAPPAFDPSEDPSIRGGGGGQGRSFDYATLVLPEVVGPVGPEGGMTLDELIEILLRCNPKLQSLRDEIPQARADILSAGLRANPLIYTDAQAVPYGSYSATRMGGVQYDLSITYPIDLSHKRAARLDVAARIERIVEAQFLDAVRQKIDELYTAYVGVLAAELAVKYRGLGLAGAQEAVAIASTPVNQETLGTIRIQRIAANLASAEADYLVADDDLKDKKEAIAVLLGMPIASAATLAVRGTVEDTTPGPGPEPELLELARRSRPDLIAWRLGVGRADAGVGLARANRLDDIYVLYQPFTAHVTPGQPTPPTSWALGVTVPMPLFNRNQGNIQKARIKAAQTRKELAGLEQQVALEVHKAAGEYELSKKLLDLRTQELTRARYVYCTALDRWRNGRLPGIDFLPIIGEYNTVNQRYRETLIRHRRSMLSLNTAVGTRVLP